MTRLTDAEIATMPQIADATLADTFHWGAAEEDRLYRDCPTAFWLAPGGDDALPPTDGPRPAVVRDTEVADRSASVAAEGVLPAIGFAMGVAGPVFVAGLSLVGESYQAAIVRLAMGVMLGIASSPLSIPFGAVAGALPILIGVSLLAYLGAEHPLARRRSLWAATGIGMGLLIAAIFDAGMVTIPLVLTSAVCAAVAHLGIDWVATEPA